MPEVKRLRFSAPIQIAENRPHEFLSVRHLGAS